LNKLTTLATLTISSLVGSLYVVFRVLTSHGELPTELRFWGSVLTAGVLIGSILTFDKEFYRKNQDRPGLRILISAAAGLCFGLINSFSVEGIVASVLIYGILGFVGFYWLKHV
jgi:hypothetical protein